MPALSREPRRKHECPERDFLLRSPRLEAEEIRFFISNHEQSSQFAQERQMADYEIVILPVG